MNELQPIDELEAWHKQSDPWKYEENPEDVKRREMLFNALPKKSFKRVLDIGCGQGFITSQIIGDTVIGVDISEEAIKHAKSKNISNVKFVQGSIFEMDKLFDKQFDLILITGVLYKQYIGDSSSLIYMLMNKLLEKGGYLVTVHINEWNICQFPLLKLKEEIYPYREYNHKLEIYVK